MTSLSYDVYVRAKTGQVRAALTDPALVPGWLTGMQFNSDDAGRQYRLTCEWLQTDHLAANDGSPSVVRFELIAMGEVTRVTVTHRDLSVAGPYFKVVAAGWPMILSSLKSLVETGHPLEFRRSA